MAASYNRVILIGNLTRDPELKYTQSGLALTEIGLAVNDRRKGQNGEWVDETTFVDITLWGRTAEVVSEYCSKGKPIMVEGRLKLDTWETEGQKRSKLRVVGEKIQLLGGKDGAPQGGGDGYSRPQQSTSKPSQSHNQQSDYDSYDQGGGGDDVPF